MARPARGSENLEWSREVLARAQTVEQLRQAQAVVLPLDYGLSLEQTARPIGRSVPWTCQLRNRFLAGEIVGDGQRESRGGRRRQNMTAEQEAQALAPFPDRASSGGIVVVGLVKAELEAQLGRPMALSSVYKLLHRHGWRNKLARTSDTPKATSRFSRSGKKLSGRLAEIGSLWPGQKPIKLCQAMLTHEYTYAAVDVLTGELDSLILPHVNTHCMQLFLDEVGQRHPGEHIVVVLDGAGWHASDALHPHPTCGCWACPPYAPALNPVERVWDELREKRLHNHVFDSLDALEDHLEVALRDFEQDRQRIRSIVAWPWIIDALLNSVVSGSFDSQRPQSEH